MTALRKSKTRGATLDVTYPEPLPEDSPLWGLSDVIIISHMTGSTPHYWERPWALLVDIDAKEIARERAADTVSEDVEVQDTDELLDAAGILDSAPAGFPYAFENVDHATEYGFEVRDVFEEDFNAVETVGVYSGQGVHVYLLDTDPSHRYDAQSREVLNDLPLETYEIPIDPVVTADRRRVARLHYSLHADVCSIVHY